MDGPDGPWPGRVAWAPPVGASPPRPLLFNQPLFLFAFLPAVLALYALATVSTRALGGERLGQLPRNLVLLIASLAFYFYGEQWLVLAMLASIAGNYALGLGIGAARDSGSPGRARVFVGLGLLLNLGLLGYYKYANFLVGSFVDGWAEIALPIGISFYTFQALSYLIDVQRGDAAAQRDPFAFALYIALFPQLIAGPIVRYRDLAAQLVERRVDVELFGSGVRRFVIGLAKKVLIADQVAWGADQVYAYDASELSMGLAWVGLLAYTLQIYFDFSGYSDMAIGLGRMLGFRFRENFRWPYASRSITEFWRRWHISLSSWFRDYLYIPLGGNRKGPARTYANLVIVFLLCGLWHGDAWAFVAWGAFHGLFLVLERRGLRARVEALGPLIAWGYTVLVVMLGWNLFRSEELIPAGQRYLALVGGGEAFDAAYRFGRLMQPSFVLALVSGCLLSFPWLAWIAARRDRDLEVGAHRGAWAIADALGTVGLVLLWVAALAFSAASTYSPFIYFRF